MRKKSIGLLVTVTLVFSLMMGAGVHAEPKCAHEHVKYDDTEWGSEAIAYGEHDENGHYATYPVTLHGTCLDCGERITQESVSDEVYESHRFENGVCACGYENPCEHLNIEYDEEQWDYERPVYGDYDENGHYVSYPIIKYGTCTGCGEYVTEETVSEEEYEWGHCFKDGVCACGYENPCEHEWNYDDKYYDVNWESDELAFTSVNNLYHIVTGPGYECYSCLLCGEEHREEVILDEENAVLWDHSYENGYCVDCGNAVKPGWDFIDGGWHYFYADGSCPFEWARINNVWYYFYGYGWMATGWLDLDGVWYYCDSSGAMVTNWQKIGGTWYYFNGSGAMVTGWQRIGGTWYYLKSSGAMATGWQKIGGTWYYLKSSGAMATGWQKIGGTWYYLKSSGAMATGWQKIGGTWYYLKSSGAMATGWQKIGGTWYYFNGSGAMVTGTVTIGGKRYRFSSNGAWIG